MQPNYTRLEVGELQVQNQKLPRSKFQRELLRIVVSTMKLPRHALQLVLATRRYDRSIGRHLRAHQGDQPEARKVAIYLIYPRKGLKPSHVAAIKYISRSGYAPVVVSNLELSSGQRDCLLKLSWLYIERPNIGYDFGGYRDAILHLDLQHRSVERLALFNDSCWFPVPSESDWLVKAEQLNMDMVGSMSCLFIPRRFGGRLESFKWSYDPHVRKFHYSSYALLFSGQVARSPGFSKFWRKLPLFNDQEHVTKYGEVGITRWIKRNSYSHSSTVGIQHLDRELDKLTCLELRNVLETIVSPWSSEYVAMKIRLLEEYEESGAWKRKVVQYLLFVAYRGPPCYSLPDYLSRYHDFGFLKKATVRGNEDSAKVMKDVARWLDDRCDFDLCFEVAEVAAEVGM